MRTVAVDWSGAASPASQRRHIWAALVDDGRVVSLEGGRTRQEVVDWVIGLAAGSDPDLVVGLDFSFSFPEWFVTSCGAATGPGFWQVVAEEGERWLRDCADPFWGRPGRPRPALPAIPGQFRRTDLDCPPVAGIRPKSVFQVSGAGSVGAGSIRGIPQLVRLSAAGFSVWPFATAAGPTVLEVYPRIMTGPVTKSDPRRRSEYLERARSAHPELFIPSSAVADAEAGEDAFDALVSALGMYLHRHLLADLPAVTPLDRVEGRIWTEAGPLVTGMPTPGR